MLTRKLTAEFIGTMWLVLGGCGSAVFAANYLSPGPDIKYNLGIGFVGVSFAFGLTVLTMAYAIGHISGCHLNPAVSVGLCTAGRFPAAELLPYIAAQTLGAAAGAGLIYLIVSGGPDFKGFDSTQAGVFATNGYGAMSPGKFPLLSCLVAEVVLTAFFLFIILGSTDRRAAAGFAPLPIGLGLTLIHLVSIPITNTSVNPARSTGVALFVGGDTLTQLWLFWLAPVAGAAVAAVVYRFVSATDDVTTA